MTIIGITTIALSLIVTGLGLTSRVRKNKKGKAWKGFLFSIFLFLQYLIHFGLFTELS